MRHYEIVCLIHPDQSAQISGMMARYSGIVVRSGGVVHRQEDWGRRALAYTINKLRKAHYILMNIECSNEVLNELKEAFRYNDIILRHLVIKRSCAITQASPLIKVPEKNSGKFQSAEFTQKSKEENV